MCGVCRSGTSIRCQTGTSIRGISSEHTSITAIGDIDSGGIDPGHTSIAATSPRCLRSRTDRGHASIPDASRAPRLLGCAVNRAPGHAQPNREALFGAMGGDRGYTVRPHTGGAIADTRYGHLPRHSRGTHEQRPSHLPGYRAIGESESSHPATVSRASPRSDAVRVALQRLLRAPDKLPEYLRCGPDRTDHPDPLTGEPGVDVAALVPIGCRHDRA